MATIYIMCGLPFSGKTTLSKAISEHQGIPRVSFDETWLAVEKEKGSIPGTGDTERGQYVNETCEEIAQNHLCEGKSVVYDNLGHSLFERNKMKNLAKQVNAEAKIIFIDVSKEEVIKRRGHNLTTQQRAQVTDFNFNNALEAFEPPTFQEMALIYKPDQNMEAWIEKITR